MTRLQKGLLIGAVSFVLLMGACGAGFYFAIYKPYASPMMAMSISHALDQQLSEKDFTKPGSGEVTTEQLRRFIAVEEAVETRIGDGRSALVEQQAVLERAGKAGDVVLDAALGAFGAVKPMLMDAKPRQIEIMTRERFSKREFEWVRDQLYRAAGINLTRVDVSDLFAGAPEPAIRVRALSPQEVPAANQTLVGPIVARLEAWRAFAFFGL
jgi:hypothetical protein